MRMKDKVTIVTGSAQGIGRGIAERIASEGGKVVIADLNGDKATATAKAIKDKGGEAIGVAVDVSKRDQVKAMIDAAVKAYGKLDVIFNNAGFNRPMKFLEVTEDNWNAIMSVNALGCLIGMQEAAKQMIKQGNGGKIINTTSMAGRQGFPDFTPYSASKFAVVALIQAGARELTPKYGITVNGFGPGVVDTPLWEQLDKDLMGIGSSKEVGQAMKDFSAGILRGRAATPEDIAGTGLFLASSDSDYMTGQIVMIDGGMTLV